jgi:MoxR-like ATPase
VSFQRRPAADVIGARAHPVDHFARGFADVRATIEQVIRGKREVVELALVCLMSEGHLLVEDVPGVGKTTLARCLAACVDARWSRVQFTPDLLPSDVTGVTIYNQRSGEFEFHPGPVFANIVLADEINRASPKTQAALLEVMEERRVTVDGVAHAVPRPFMVVATQNPIDMDGTYALPEAQLDRFLMRVSVGYPDPASEVEVLAGMPTGPMVDALRPVLTTGEVAALVELAQQVHVSPILYEYVVQIAAATRASAEVRLGASPRGSLALVRAARARAAAAGRHYAVPEDVKALAAPVLAHRLVLLPEAELRGRTPGDVLASALETVPAPKVADRA